MNFLNGLKTHTGLVVVILAFVYEKIGLSKEDADATITAVIACIGAVIAVIGYVHKVIKALRKK